MIRERKHKMKTKKLMNLAQTVLLSALLFALPASGDTGTLKVPTESGQTNVTAQSVYVAGPNDPGILITAKDQPVSAVVKGDVSALYGGVDMETSGSGQVKLETGRIRGRFGVLAYINGGRIEGNSNSVTASGDTALEAVLGKSGSFQFTSFSISSSDNAVTLETGADFSGHIFDPQVMGEPENPGEDGWDVIVKSPELPAGMENSGKSALSEDFSSMNPDLRTDTPAGSSYSGAAASKDPGGSNDVVINSGIIEAGMTAVDITLNDARMVSVSAEEITAGASGVLVELSKEGGTVNLTSPVIDADEKGVMINAPAGTVTVTADEYIGGRSVAEVYNSGGDVTLNAGLILGDSGLFIESSAGTTDENTEDIVMKNYGIYVHTHDAVDEQTFDPAGNNSDESGSGSQNGAPAVKVTIDGDVSDYYEFPEEPEDGYDLPPEKSEAKGIAKDGEEETGDENEETTAGVIVQAETAGTIDITVKGRIFTSYGNEIDADKGAEVSVSVQDDVNSIYGNRLSADNASVGFSVGGSLNAGEKALDTLASSNGVLDVRIGKDIVIEDSESDEDQAGIHANSMENGVTKIKVNGGISVRSENDENTAYGIYSENTGGDISISVEDNVEVNGSSGAGVVIINGSDSEYSEIGSDDASAVKTNVEILGDLSGKSKGLYIDGTGPTLAAVFVEGTIAGDDAGVEISDETAVENVDLTAWKIVMKNGKAVTGGSQAEAVEDNTKYLIKYAPNVLEGRVRVVDSNGDLLPESHGYQYAKDGEVVYFRPAAGNIDAVYNGMDSRMPLQKEADGSFSLRIPTGGGIWISLGSDPEPVEPLSPSDNDLFWLYDRELPGTGFPGSRVTSLAIRPLGLRYESTGFILQIPSLDVEEEIVSVPLTDGRYPVDWLGSSVGFLEESSLPGEGITVLTGHNHLNTMEAGPFLFIKTLEAGDRLMVTSENGTMLRYSVYGNYRIASDDFASLAGELRPNSLVMITCEDESIGGGYINRRVILAGQVE